MSLVLIVAAFCWCWRLRSLRKSIKEIEQQRHRQRMELLEKYGKLLSNRMLVADDLPLIVHLERTERPDELRPPTAP